MAGDDRTTVGRRAMLVAVAGGAAALAAQAATAMLPGAAQAADGDKVTLGQNNGGSSPTWVSSSAASPALGGTSGAGDGIRGDSKAPERSGIYGTNSSAEGYGVYGWNGGNERFGFLGGPTAGASGVGSFTDGSLGTPNTGVDGRNRLYGTSGSLGSQGAGAEGSNDAGTAGALGVWNSGVWAKGTNKLPALKVDGAASFRYSGIAQVPKGKSSVTVAVQFGTVLPLSGLAMLQAHRPGAAVAATVVNRSAGKVTIYLTKAVTSVTPVAYYVFHSGPA